MMLVYDSRIASSVQMNPSSKEIFHTNLTILRSHTQKKRYNISRQNYSLQFDCHTTARTWKLYIYEFSAARATRKYPGAYAGRSLDPRLF